MTLKTWAFLALLVACALALALALTDRVPGLGWLAIPLVILAVGLMLLAFVLARPALRRWLAFAGVVLFAAGPLGACAGLPGGLGSNAAAMNSGFAQFLTDPNCAHHDEATLITGAAGMPASFQAKAVRDCPARASAAGVAALGVAPAAGAAPVAAAPVSPPPPAATP